MNTSEHGKNKAADYGGRDFVRRANGGAALRLFSFLALPCAVIAPIFSCSLFESGTKGYEPNREIRSEIAGLRRGKVVELQFVDFNMRDVDGNTPFIRDPALVRPLMDALRTAERSRWVMIDPSVRIDFYDVAGRERGSLSVDFPSAGVAIGPRWTDALLRVRRGYAAEVRRRVRDWKPTDRIAIRHAEAFPPPIADGPPPTSPPPPGSPFEHPMMLIPYGSLEEAKPEAGMVTRPEDAAQIIALLSSGDARLYAFDAPYRAALKIDRITKQRTETVYVVLPVVREGGGKLWFDSALEPLGMRLTLLDQLSQILPRL